MRSEELASEGDPAAAPGQSPEASALGFHSLRHYQPLIGEDAVNRIEAKIARLTPIRIVNISSTHYGGGVSEMLSPLTLLLNSAGIRTGWRVLQGTPELFAITKEIHNGLQGAGIELTPAKKQLYQQVVLENAARMHFDEHEIVIVHDPQPLPIVHRRHGKRACIWQCHIDLTIPNPTLWHYLCDSIQHYDAVVLSLPEYKQPLDVPQHFIMPAINPFSPKNREMSQDEIRACLDRYKIPNDVPLVVQVSRFDRWKDPEGVVEAFRLARRHADAVLVLVGNRADDDPEGQRLFDTIYQGADADVIVVMADDPLLVNALQRNAAVVVQKSLREGFGLTVAEAMWKGACVIGGNVGGIRHQITDGEDGFLVDGPDQAARRMIQLLHGPKLRYRLGQRARETARSRFLMSRLVEDWVDLISLLLSDDRAGEAGMAPCG